MLTSHVIQYQDPLFRELAADADIDLTVFFCSDWGAKSYRDPGFGREVKWDLEKMREGYLSAILKNWSPRPHVSRFWGLINPGIAAELAKGTFDALWVHGWSNCTAWIAMTSAFLLGIPVLLRGENHLLTPPSSRFRQELKHIVLGSLFRRISGFLAIGKLNADFYRAYGVPAERIFDVPYCVDNAKFLARRAQLQPIRDEVRARMGVEKDVPVVLFSGKLIANKAPMDLLRAFEGSVRECPAHLVFLGDGQLAPELKRYAENRQIPNVHFAGFRNQGELAEFFVAADIFVLPSHFERWGLVVNEALCFGLPVIASDKVGATGDLVEHGCDGFVYPAGDVAALRDALLTLMTDSDLRERMSRASLDRVQNWNYQADIAGIRASLQAVTKVLA